MKTEITCHDISVLGEISGQLIKAYPEQRVFAFYGAMGAGKTTFIQAICKYLGVIDTVSSPTFSLVNEYRTSEGEPVYHFDFYRINNIAEAMDIGYEHYFFSTRYCFIEWPENIAELLPENCVYVEIKESGNGAERIIRF
ncbi:MAG: tRNA (adenosine(37)-N6)-threonylcarbamoyltransferase complex ATPase subunit type 1 TsaE [Bacteroidetes bacterium]|nr:tRNA (adenosine(37)-N6)-threonylcarbamoyltransferase complex ATPase subunit type 1 TsaE [Bacteroidota bacterium]